MFQWTSNELLWHLKLNWLTTLDPSVSVLASDAYFQLKWPYFVYLAVYGTENLNNSNQNYLGGSFQFIGTHFYHNQNKIQNFHFFHFFFFFAFLQVLLRRYVEFSDPYTGGSSSKLLSSMLLYNHSPYFKSGEINSNRLSPLPTRMLWSYLYL